MFKSPLWRHVDFLKLWTGQTVSVFGSIIGGSALSFTALLVLDATPMDMSILHILELLPGFLVGLLAGAWVDKVRRRPLMILADLGRAVALASIPLAALLHRLEMLHLFAVALVTAVLTLLFNLAYQAHLPDLIGSENVLEGNSKTGATAAVAEMAGFDMAGWLVQFIGAPFTMLVNAVSFLVSALSIGMIRQPERALIPVEGQDLFGELREGFEAVGSHAFLRASAWNFALQRFSGTAFDVLVVLWMVRGIGFEPGVLAMTWAVGGVSSFAGALITPRINRRMPPNLAAVLGLGIFSLISCILPAASGPTILSLILLVALQLGDGFYVLYDINMTSTRQQITSPEVLGRVTATLEVIGLGAALAGALAGGWLGENWDVRMTLVLAAVLQMLSVLVLFAMLRRNGLLNFRPSEPGPEP